MIRDEENNEIFYWPIVNLVEGETSEVIIIRIDTPSEAVLMATNDARIIVWAKWMQFPLNPFTNISDGTGISLFGIPGPYGEFSIYVEALAPMENAFERVPITVLAAISEPAGWTA